MKFVVDPLHVAQSFQTLRGGKIHPHFSGYLAVKWTAMQAGQESGLQPRFAAFFSTFLRVADFSEGKPFLVPFRNDNSTRVDFNRNVAGSYSPASLRKVLGQVIDIEGERSDARYSLRSGHAALALEHLCYGQQVPALALATLLYRDYALESSEGASASAFVDAFRREFGFANDGTLGQSDFATLFTYDPAEGADWQFQILDE